MITNMKLPNLIFAAALFCALPSAAQAQTSVPAPLSSKPIPAAVDRPYPGGTMTLDIDASDITRRLYRVTQTIPVAPGTTSLTLLYPKWLPGKHGPRGPIAQVAGLSFSSNGQPLAWQRDPLDVYAFHLQIPAATREVVARFVHTSPLRPSEGRRTMTPEMLNLQWEKMSLYPAGHYTRRIGVRPSVTLPDGWTAATALSGRSTRGNRVVWSQTDYETLVDSPIFAGAHYRQWSLGNTVRLSAVADTPGLLVLGAKNQAALSRLVDEALLTFGSAPYDSYNFLVALSDQIGGIGLEHQRSSENQLEPRNFHSWSEFDWDRNVLAHELVHAWNGKYRRPARQWTPDFRTPMQDDLLWIYEGQTHFWGWVLAARSGLQTQGTVLGIMAHSAGRLAESPGRSWRSVADTTHDPIIAARKPKPYLSFARGEDYYSEGALVWLEADQIIRAGTNGQRGLDDFAREFFAYSSRNPGVNRYELKDVLAALNRIFAHDWRAFFRNRIERPGRAAPLAGIEQAGYRLVWKDRPNPYSAARMKHADNLDLGASLGMTVDKNGNVRSPRWGGPAFKAGVVTGTRIVAVHGLAYTQQGLRQAIARAARDKQPIELLVRRGSRFETVRIPYTGGLRWPWLESESPGRTAPLDLLLAPKKAG